MAEERKGAGSKRKHPDHWTGRFRRAGEDCPAPVEIRSGLDVGVPLLLQMAQLGDTARHNVFLEDVEQVLFVADLAGRAIS